MLVITVKLRGREGKEMNSGENEEMHGKRNRGQGVKVRGQPPPPPPPGGQEEGPKVFVSDAKGWQLKMYGPQANRLKVSSQKPVVGEATG